MTYDPNIDGPADILGFKAAAVTARNARIAREARDAERENANRVVAEWEQEVEKWKKAYAKLEQAYYTKLDTMGAMAGDSHGAGGRNTGTSFPAERRSPSQGSIVPS